MSQARELLPETAAKLEPPRVGSHKRITIFGLLNAAVQGIENEFKDRTGDLVKKILCGLQGTVQVFGLIFRCIFSAVIILFAINSANVIMGLFQNTKNWSVILSKFLGLLIILGSIVFSIYVIQNNEIETKINNNIPRKDLKCNYPFSEIYEPENKVDLRKVSGFGFVFVLFVTIIVALLRDREVLDSLRRSIQVFD